MIIDLNRFIDAEQPVWAELESRLDELDEDLGKPLDLESAQRLHYLYQRTSADLQKVMTYAAEPELQRYLESLVARAYGEIHDSRSREGRFQVVRWVSRDIPRTFRRHAAAFVVALTMTLMGGVIGGLAFEYLPEAKAILVPPGFDHLLNDPSQHIAQVESGSGMSVQEQAEFAGYLMSHNIRVSFTALSLGFTFGIGTIVVMIFNGALLGLVAVDYVEAGEMQYLLAWLLPHGSVEIPAILIAGQAGLVLARAMIGWGDRQRMRARFRAISGDLVTLAGLVVILLIWAGLIESFFSQYGQQHLPYSLKIAFGFSQLLLLFGYLCFVGSRDTSEAME